MEQLQEDLDNLYADFEKLKDCVQGLADCIASSELSEDIKLKAMDIWSDVTKIGMP